MRGVRILDRKRHTHPAQKLKMDRTSFSVCQTKGMNVRKRNDPATQSSRYNHKRQY
jgi:hypothetical protein